jgi:quinol monooxygenase YgiN
LEETNAILVSPSALYVVTHIDIFPPSQAAGLDQIRALSDDSRKDEGNIRFDALQQTNRGNHIILVETCDGMKAIEAHGLMNTCSSSAKRYLRSAGASTTSAFTRRSTERTIDTPRRFPI